MHNTAMQQTPTVSNTVYTVSLLVTEHKSMNSLNPVSTSVRVFVDNDLHYGYFVDEHKLFGMLSAEQQERYLESADCKLEVSRELAQAIIDIGATPYAKQRVLR